MPHNPNLKPKLYSQINFDINFSCYKCSEDAYHGWKDDGAYLDPETCLIMLVQIVRHEDMELVDQNGEFDLIFFCDKHKEESKKYLKYHHRFLSFTEFCELMKHYYLNQVKSAVNMANRFKISDDEIISYIQLNFVKTTHLV